MIYKTQLIHKNAPAHTNSNYVKKTLKHMQ